MKAIIHIGTEKTGTTTLQSFIVHNRNKFLENGYYIPESIGVGNNRGLASCSMNAGKLDDYYHSQGVNSPEKRYDFDKDLLSAFNEEINSLNESYHTVIITSEHFHSRCVSETEIENVKNILSPYFKEFEVVVYLRPQIDMAVSLYSTHLRSGSSSKFDDFLNSHCRSDNVYYNYSELLEKWSQVFGEGNLRVRVFDRNAMINGDIIDDFFEVVGFQGSLSDFARLKNLNESLTPFGQEILRLSNHHNFNFVVNGVFFKDELLRLVNGNFTGKGCSPNYLLAQNIQNYFEISNTSVAKKWFGREKLFDFNFEAYGEGNKLDSAYENALNFFFSYIQNVTQKEINTIRDAALIVEKESIPDALELMKIALKLRPDGKFLEKKISEYKAHDFDLSDSLAVKSYHNFEDDSLEYHSSFLNWGSEELNKSIKYFYVNDEINKNSIDFPFSEKDVLLYESQLISKVIIDGAASNPSFEIMCPVNKCMATFSGAVSLGGRNALRFSGKEPFYILQENFTCECFFYPLRNSVYILASCLNPSGKIKDLLDKINKYGIEYKKYFLKESSFSGVMVSHQSPFHYYYFKIGAIFRLAFDKSVESVDVLTLPGQSFFNLETVFDFCRTSNVRDLFVKADGKFLPKEIADNDYTVIVGDRRKTFDNNFLKILDKEVLKGLTSDIDLNKKTISFNYDKEVVLWLGVCSGKRVWLEEVESYSSLIKLLSTQKKKVHVYVDGWTMPLNNQKGDMSPKLYDGDAAVFDKLKKSVTQENVFLESLVGKKAEEKILKAINVDFFIANHATGSMWISRVLGKPGVTHISNAARKSAIGQHFHPKANIVPESYVTDMLNDDEKTPFHVSYSIDKELFITFCMSEMKKINLI